MFRSRRHTSLLRMPAIFLLALPVIFVMLLMLTQTASANAGSGLLTSSLGRWLDTQAAPELGKLLGRHPMFKGETIQIISMRNGKPVDHASRLHQAVEEHLTQRLLNYPGVKIAWAKNQPSCGTPQHIPYLLGIDIERDGSRKYRLNLSMVDVAESVWVSGANYTWRGQLSANEVSAFATAMEGFPRGTVDSPLPADASSRIAKLMQQHLSCVLPDGLEGPVYLTPAERGNLGRIISQLQTELTLTPVAAVTRNSEEANWVMSLHSTSIGSGTRELVLMLENRDTGISQQIASVFVVGLDGPRRSERVHELIAGGQLLTDMLLNKSSATGICERSRDCVEVTFDLLEPVYLFVLSTRDRHFKSLSCDPEVSRATAGEHRYRLRLPPASAHTDAPDMGIYAVAAKDRRTARQLARHIRAAPGACRQQRDPEELERWLRELDELIEQYPDIEWRTMHLANTRDGIVQL